MRRRHERYETGAVNWNPNGTLNQVAVTDGFNSGGTQTCNYNPSSVAGTGYDDLGRLVGVSCGSVWGQTFSYDQYDNVTKSGSSQWMPGYNSANNHYANGSTYDNNGNLTSDTLHTYTWDPFNKLSTIDSSACATNGECVTYDAFGRIVETSYAGAYTEIWYTQVGKTEYMHGSTPYYAYWPAPGGTAGEVNGDNSTVFFMHKDWLPAQAELGRGTLNSLGWASPHGRLRGNNHSDPERRRAYSHENQVLSNVCHSKRSSREAGRGRNRFALK